MIELLSPAGDKPSFIAAVQAGADAVYMGLEKFNARIMTENFTIDDYIWCLDYAHIYGVKVYLTLNVLFSSDEVKEALDLVLTLYNHGLDAVILQDIGMATVIKKYIPSLALHASTQMTVHNLKQALFLQEFGFKRIVLAREMTLAEIEHISNNVNVELEVFIHGALCVSYSGQCLMSYMIGRRSANRGKCGGTCRLRYSLYENNKEIFSGHLLSKKDIFGTDYVEKLKNMGISSLKIEGRGKTREYVSVITSKYRKILDKNMFSKDDEKDMLQIFNRTSKSSGYFEKVLSKESISYKIAKNTGLYLGNVIDVKNKMIKIKLQEDISMHDGIESESSDSSTIVTCIKDINGNIVNRDVSKSNVVWLGDFNVVPKVGDKINKTSSKKLIDAQNEFLSKIRRKVSVNLSLKIKKNRKVYVLAENTLSNSKIEFEIDYIPEIAVKKKLSIDDIKHSITKTEGTYFNFNIQNLELDDNLFMPTSKLNDIRRNVIEKLIEMVKVRNNLTIDYSEDFTKSIKDKKALGRVNSLFIYKYNKDDLKKYNDCKFDYVYLNISDVKRHTVSILDSIYNDIYIYIPNVVLANLDAYIEENLGKILENRKVKGILVGNLGYLELARKYKKMYNIKLVIDYSLNVTNIFSAMFFKEFGADAICLSPEVDVENAENISKVIDTECNLDYITCMTSRFCPIKSFSGGCNCSKNEYYLVDSYKNKYDIVCDNIDCMVKLIRKFTSAENKVCSIHRHNSI